jgi:hypothetical protein
MDQFSKPPARPPKIPPVTPLEALPEAKQAEYKDVATAPEAKLPIPAEKAAIKVVDLGPPLPAETLQVPAESAPGGFTGDLSVGGGVTLKLIDGRITGVGLPEPEPETPPVPGPEEPTEEDKREFIRCVLGGVPYVKTFVLLGGQLQITFRDRGTETTERIYVGAGDNSLKFARCCLLASLIAVNKEEHVPPKDVLTEGHDALTKLSRPMYEILMDTARKFDAHMGRLIDEAHNPDFWQPAGAS